MATNQTSASTHAGIRVRPLLTATGAIGVGYTLSWMAGLSVRAPSPRFAAPGADIVSALAGHSAALTSQFALTEGLPALGIAVISAALARAAAGPGRTGTGRTGTGRTGTGRTGTGRIGSRVLLTAGLTSAAISFTQFVLGLLLVRTQNPGSAHLLYTSVNRLDGVKMLTLAVLGATAAGTAVLPRWLRYTGSGLAVTIAVSGVVYLLLVQSLTVAAGPALLFLLVFITGTGITLGMKAR
jgi:hypothetical protein